MMAFSSFKDVSKMQILAIRPPPALPTFFSCTPCSTHCISPPPSHFSTCLRIERKLWRNVMMMMMACLSCLRHRGRARGWCARQPNHQLWYAKWKAQLEHVHVAYAFFFARLAPICMLGRCSLTKFLHRSSVGVKGVLLVGNLSFFYLEWESSVCESPGGEDCDRSSVSACKSKKQCEKNVFFFFLNKNRLCNVNTGFGIKMRKYRKVEK